MRKLALIAIVVVLCALSAGRILVVRDLRRADAILVLDGESDRRPALALDLMQQGYAPRALLDVSSGERIYRWTHAEIADQYIRSLPPEIAARVSVCGISAFSTREEAVQARRCLDATGARSVLLVTSEYHSRRALSIFRHAYSGWQIGVVGTVEPDQFGVNWWRQRQWAKVTVDEWARLIWWECVERWRNL